MPQPAPSFEQVIDLVRQLPIASQYKVLTVLKSELPANLPEPDLEIQTWLEADFGEDLPPYEWDEAGIPTGIPVRYVPGRGLVMEGDKTLAE
jgi:hypothetical protein